MKIAVLPQYLLLPMALTTAATDDGPEPSRNGGRSDVAGVGVNHVTLASPSSDVLNVRCGRRDHVFDIPGCRAVINPSNVFHMPAPRKYR